MAKDAPQAEFHTSDLSIAAWLSVSGFELLGCGLKDGRRGRHWYKFADPDGNAQAKANDFANSDMAKFDATLRRLKSLVYATKQVPPRSEIR